MMLALLVQYLVDEGYGNRPLSHRRCDAFDIAFPNVSHREDTRQAGFEEMRRPGERPVRGREILGRQARSRFDESLRVERDAAPEPFGGGNGAGHDEQVSDRTGLGARRPIVPPLHALEMVRALQGHDFRVGSQDDRRTPFDALDRKSTRLNSSHGYISYAVF